MLRVLCITLLGLEAAFSEEDRSTAEWIKKLEARYDETGGYIATYQGQSKDNTLGSTVAFDKASGLCAVEVSGNSDGKDIQFRFWTTSDDTIFMDSGNGRRARIDGIRSELSYLVSFKKIASGLSDPITTFDLTLSPGFLLEADTVGMGIRSTHDQKTDWFNAVKRASVQAVNKSNVVFRTKKHGDISISRKTGIMTAQSIPQKDGSDRSIKLTDLKANPGQENLEKISEDWSTLGAQKIAVGVYNAKTRRQTFQQVITGIEEGHADLGKLEKKLEEDEVRLRRFADASITRKPDSLYEDPLWKKLLPDIKRATRRAWLKNIPGSKPATEKDFKIFLMNPEVRAGLRDTLIEKFASVPGVSDKVPTDIFQMPLNDALITTNEAGNAARNVIKESLTKAYLGAVVDRKMAAAWGEREGLD
ncbi:hypothetical protein [Haloferula sp.]|uniref:hypothetical protein n=1 Tax=Haloferula sp. TaxID=2497595 RepID=UPI00329C3CB8